MKIIFPEPILKKTAWISMPVVFWEAVEKLQKERSLSQEQILNAFLTAGWTIFKEDRESSPLPQKDSSVAEKAGEMPSKMQQKAEGIEKKRPWSTLYPACRSCGETVRSHMGRGYCSRCYSRQYIKEKDKAPEKPERPRMISVQQQKVIDNRAAEDKHIARSIETCPCPRAEKFVRGLGVFYKGDYYAKDACLEETLNKDIPGNEDLPENLREI